MTSRSRMTLPLGAKASVAEGAAGGAAEPGAPEPVIIHRFSGLGSTATYPVVDVPPPDDAEGPPEPPWPPPPPLDGTKFNLAISSAVVPNAKGSSRLATATYGVLTSNPTGRSNPEVSRRDGSSPRTPNDTVASSGWDTGVRRALWSRSGSNGGPAQPPHRCQRWMKTWRSFWRGREGRKTANGVADAATRQPR